MLLIPVVLVIGGFFALVYWLDKRPYTIDPLPPYCAQIALSSRAVFAQIEAREIQQRMTDARVVVRKALNRFS
jgi:hypothetical protein